MTGLEALCAFGENISDWNNEHRGGSVFKIRLLREHIIIEGRRHVGVCTRTYSQAVLTCDLDTMVAPDQYLQQAFDRIRDALMLTPEDAE